MSLTKGELIESMVELSLALKDNDIHLYYYYTQVLRDLYQYAHENGIDILPADLWI